MRIQTRIILPFLGLFVLSQALVAWFGLSAVSREVDRQTSATLHNLAAMISRAGFPLNSASLARIREVVGYDLAIASPSEGLVAATFSADTAREFQAWLESPGAWQARPDGFHRLLLRGEDFCSAQASLSHRSEPESALFLLQPASRVSEAKWKAARPIAFVLSASLAGLTLLGFLIARTIAAPIRDLAHQTQNIARSGLDGRVTITSPGEVGELAQSFNQMLDCLRASHAQIVEAEKLASLGQLAAGIAHEIRNPLSSLRMTAQILERRLPEDEKVREPLRVIREEIDRLDFALSEMLSFARPRQIQIAAVSLAELMNSVLQLMARQLEHAHVRVQRDLDASAPPAAGDADQLKQVLVNLLLNAMQAMPGGGDLTLRLTRAAPDHVRLEVADTGKGIPEEYRSRLFEPFFTTREGGAGLGLAVSRRIVDQHRGRIDFMTAGAGTCFWVELPIWHSPEMPER
ncbi:MAG: HAMP domain-containing protein [Planctomycetes bacterium]|nr:HAMP domain-containing protein [Planctomycetota bacterium]